MSSVLSIGTHHSMEAFVRRFAACIFDMDGTLCTSRGHPDGHDRISSLTSAALQRYVAAGGQVIVATGRPPNAATQVLDRDLRPGIVSYLVCCDGGCVLAPVAERTGEWAMVWEQGLGGACCTRLLSALRANLPAGALHVGVQLHEGFDGFGAYGSIVSSRRVQEVLEECHPKWGEVIRNMVATGQRTAADVAARSPRVLTPEAFEATVGETEVLGWVRVVYEAESRSEPPDLTTVLQPLVEAENAIHGSNLGFVREHLAGPNTAMLRQAGTDKATALAVVADLVDVRAADCCAFGDGDNDVGMFDWAGWAVAPANCGPEAREMADTLMSKSNNEDFISDFFSMPLPPRDASQALKDAVLSEEQVAAFYRDGEFSQSPTLVRTRILLALSFTVLALRSGYIVCRGLVDPSTVHTVRLLGEQKFIAASDDATSPIMRWTPAVFNHEAPLTDAALHALLRDPSLVSAASQLLGGAPARVYYGMLAVVPPNGGTGLPWHSDNM